MAEPAAASAPKPSAQVVPADREGRDAVRAAVRAWVHRASLVPPLDLAALRTLAAHALRELRLAEQHLDFVTLLLGNAAWEDVFAATPFERRVLLLPQCLRSPESCEAPWDAIGLACLRCGGCAIGGLEAEAEALGYHVLVAEGTTAAARLVESGGVQAVLAVACLESLERSFSSAAAGAVPALAVPLLNAGCRGTRVDVAWLREELRLRNEARRFWHFHLDRLREIVKGWFERETLAPLLCREGTGTEALACEAVACGGKRWRPTLTVAVRQALCESDGEPPEAVRRVAVAVECFHKASLVHDDIEDGDLERNGRAAVHAAQGVPIALNVGDLLIGEGYRLIAEAGLPGAVTARLLGVVAAAQRELCLGQGEELAWVRKPRPLPVDEALTLLRRKTGPAFEVGLLLGALAGGADEATCAALRALSSALGLAYQIRDDIEDQSPGVNGGAPSPLFVALAAESRGEDFARRWVEGRVSEAERAEAHERLAARGWQLFERYRGESLGALRPIRQQALKGLLFRLVYLFLGRGDQGAEATRPRRGPE